MGCRKQEDGSLFAKSEKKANNAATPLDIEKRSALILTGKNSGPQSPFQPVNMISALWFTLIDPLVQQFVKVDYSEIFSVFRYHKLPNVVVL